MTGNTSLLTAVPAIPTNHSLSAAAIGVPTAAAVPGVVPAVVAAAAVVPSAGTVPAPLAPAVPAPLPAAGTVPAPLPPAAGVQGSPAAGVQGSPAAGVQGLPAAGVQVLPASARVVEVNEFLEVNIYFYCMHVLLLYRKNTKTYFWFLLLNRVSEVNDYVDIRFREYFRDNEQFCETVFASSYGSSIEFLIKKKSVEHLVTLSL